MGVSIEEYGIITVKKPEFPPPRNLLIVPHSGKALTIAYLASGPNTFRRNIAEMQKPYNHPQTWPIKFREPTTAESIAAAAYKFEELAKLEIFDPHCLQVGYIVRTSEGVFANPPKDAQGDIITQESQLKHLIDSAQKIKSGKNHIYLGKNGFSFAPYETFMQGVQDADTFVQGGLARVLEHTSKKHAQNLKAIASHKSKEPIERVASLYSSVWDRMLILDGNWFGYYNGYAFKVLE